MTTELTALIQRLRERKEFFSHDRAHWYMGPGPDTDCTLAADALEGLMDQRAALLDCVQAAVEFYEARTVDKTTREQLLPMWRAALAKVSASPVSEPNAAPDEQKG